MGFYDEIVGCILRFLLERFRLSTCSNPSASVRRLVGGGGPLTLLFDDEFCLGGRDGRSFFDSTGVCVFDSEDGPSSPYLCC